MGGQSHFDHIIIIEDGASRFCHVACEEESSHDRVRPIKNRRLRYHHASIEVHQAHLISAIITPLMNDLDLNVIK